jgi:hypothetical protein
MRIIKLNSADQPEKRILGAEETVTMSAAERIIHLIDLNRIMTTIKGGRSEQILAAAAVGQPELDLGRILGLLNRHGVQYVVIGGYAVAFHGYIRATRDFDIFYPQTQENATKILAALQEYGFTTQLMVTVEDLLQTNINYKIGRPPNQLDLNPSPKGISWAEASSKAVTGEVLGQSVRFLDFDSLIKSKTAAGRSGDLVDVENLMRIIGDI